SSDVCSSDLDPYLAGQIGLGYVKGAQDAGIGVSLKHFAANNQETSRFIVDAVVDQRTLREIYLPAFETVIKGADPWSVMASYNKINGTHAAENRWLLTERLKTEWGYKGFVVSDWCAVHSTAPTVNAGMALDLPRPPNHLAATLTQAVEDGKVPSAQRDDNARRMVRLIGRGGALERGVARPVAEPTPRHAALAQSAAEEAIVLLKNNGV